MTMIESSQETPLKSLSGPILTPLDGTDITDGILPWVSRIARQLNSPLILLTAIDPDDIGYPFGMPTHSPLSTGQEWTTFRNQLEENARSHALDRLNALASLLKDQGMAAEARVVLGNPAEQILRVSEAEGCGLIAMSTHGRNLIGRSLLGSVTNRVLLSSAVPVLTVTPDKAKMFEEAETDPTTIIAPLDGSELAEMALPYIEELAGVLSLEVLLVRVVILEHPAYFYTDFGEKLHDFTEDMVAEAERYLDGVSQDLRNRGLKVRRLVLRGAAAPVLLNLARETPRNLIAMATHGRSGLTRWMMGSVTDALIRGSGDPVLVVRPQ